LHAVPSAASTLGCVGSAIPLRGVRRCPELVALDRKLDPEALGGQQVPQAHRQGTEEFVAFQVRRPKSLTSSSAARSWPKRFSCFVARQLSRATSDELFGALR